MMRINALPHIAAMSAYALAEIGDAAAISLAQNESAFPPSPLAVEAGANALGGNALYPDPDWRDLRTAIAETHPVDADCVLCGAGSMEIIGCLIRCFAGAGDGILGTQYGYLFARSVAEQVGARYVAAQETALTVDTKSILAAVSEKTRVVFVSNPGNPTGTRIGNDDLIRLRGDLPDNILLIIDQAYGEFDDQDHGDLFALIETGGVVITRSLSKAYGLAGARVGWAACPPAIAREVRKLMNPNNVSRVSQAMAAAAIRDRAYMEKTVHKTAKRRDALIRRIRGLGLETPESATNFVLIGFPSPAMALRADDALRARGLILRGMGGYGLPGCLRATIGSADAMARLGDVLEEVTRERKETTA